MHATKNRLTWLSYFIFLFLGIIYTNWGIYILYMATAYHLPISTLGYLFFIPSISQAITTYINGHILHRADIRRQLQLSLIIVSFSLLIIALAHTLLILISALLVLGIGLGILISIPNYLIISIHPQDKFSKLNILNFFYSFGAIVGPAYAGYLLHLQWNWKWVLLLSVMVGLFLFIFNQLLSFHHIHHKEESAHSQGLQQGWHISILWISIAMLCYVLAECIYSVWIVAYLEFHYQYSIGTASFVLTLFWFFIAIGRFIANFFHRLKIYQFILISSFIALIGNIAVLFTHHLLTISILTALMGIGYSSLYASLLSYGTDQLSYNCPKLMSILVIAGTTGAILSYPISSFIVNYFGIYWALVSGAIILILMIIMILATLLDKKNPHHPHLHLKK